MKSKSGDYLAIFQRSPWRKFIKVIKKVGKYAWPPLLVIVLIIGILGVAYGPSTKELINEAKAGKADLQAAEKLVVNQDFTAAEKKLISGRAHLENAQKKVKAFSTLRKVPWVKTQLTATDHLLAAAITTTSAIQRLSSWAETVVAPFKTGKAFNLGALKPDQKRQILKAIYEAQPDLQSAESSINLAMVDLQAIPTDGIVKPLADAIQPFREQLPQLQNGIHQAIPASKVIPPILGYPQSQNYLFLLQNNAELRPTGGFIGTYGILKVKDGEISSFTTDNVYNLDENAKGLNVLPPAPLTRYNKVNRWFLRDSNWSPDFPTAAQEAISFYRREGGPERSLNGVIAIDPTFFEFLLELTGPIKVDGTEFRSDNMVEQLQYQVEKGYLRQGLADSQRKEIIGALGQKLIDKLLKMPKNQYGKAWTIFQKGVSEKHLLIWEADNNRQAILTDLGWSGNVQVPQGDNLMVVDANLASLKSDPAVQRTISYKLDQQKDGLLAEVKIKYENTGKLSWKTTRYRTYTRVLVPLGSTLESSTGAMVECNNKREGKVETSEEVGHTSFAFFTCTELGATHEMVLRYRLPATVSAQVDQGEYKLLIQKQPGTMRPSLHLELNFQGKLSFSNTLDSAGTLKGGTYSQSTDLLVDRSYNFSIEK